MKTLILKILNFTFMVDGISDNNTYDEQNIAYHMIFQYLSNPAIAKDLDREIGEFSSFSVNAKPHGYILRDVAIDGRELKGKLLGDSITFDIDSLVTLDIRDFKIFDFKRLDPFPYKDDEGEISIDMTEEVDGEYVSFKDYQKLQQRIIELEMQG